MWLLKDLETIGNEICKTLDDTIMKSELQEIKTQLKELQEKVDKYENRQWPKVGDRYYYFDKRFEIEFFVFVDDKTDNTLMQNGNFFRTKEQCQEAINKIKSILK